MPNLRPFHLAQPVHNLAEADKCYGELLACPRGRTSDKWTDYNFFGHQLTVHLKPEECGNASANAVDGKAVPVKHFGVVLSMPEWKKLSERLKAANVSFIIEPYIRFEGEVGEQATLFFLDPSGNALEFKAFANDDQLFAY